MYELILIIVLIGSFCGIAVILFRKIPVLAEIPEQGKSINWKMLLAEAWQRIKNNNPFKGFRFDIFFQKVLSKVRIVILKIENKIASCLSRMRQKSQKKANADDHYWKKIRKIKNKK